MNQYKTKIFASLLFLLFVAACSTVPLTGRKQLSLVDDKTMQQQASLAYNNLLKDPKTKVVKGTANAQMVQNVGRKIAQAVETYLQQNGYANQYQFSWEFNLIESNEVNAWCMPGGKVAVYTGILPVTQNEAGLATVMGHEIAHAIARHSSERASHEMAAQGLGVGVGLATNKQSQLTQVLVNQLYGVGSQVALLKYSRSQESEADRMGLTFMAMAGYNPNEATAFWKRMAAKASGQKPPEFLSTHPSDERRIADIQSLIPEAMKYYKK
ncbi:M48 family metallopeptidase [Olivibacter ginsenosidimutans]